MSDEFPSTGRIAGIDFGTKRVGVAVTDPSRMIASPFETYARGSEAQDAAYFRRLVQEERIVGFVVGVPVHMSGDESGKSSEARRFGGWLGEVTKRPVCYHDERYSTAEADELLATAPRKRRAGATSLRDSLAAQIILTSFLQSGRSITPGSLDG